MKRLRTLLIAGLGAGIGLLAGTLPSRAATPRVRANLRGEVMILVYHKFGVDGRWSRSLNSFDSDLARLDAAGYRPITLRQYVTGDFRLPVGTTPVVITFDDGSAEQMRFNPNGQLANDSAVGRWAAFARRHPEFPVHGTFFINPGTDVFGQRVFIRRKLALLVQLGSEVGNHTLDHSDLRRLTPAGVKREIALGQYTIDRWLPGYRVESLALPYGIFPQPAGLVASGVWSGAPGPRRAAITVRWRYPAVVRVGSGPAPSPLVAGLDGGRLPRIQVFTPEFNRWMNYFAAHPNLRFVSDGRPHAAGSLAAGRRVRAPSLRPAPRHR